MVKSNRDRERALAWIANQLHWERTLASLRREPVRAGAEVRQAA
ncbi:MAG TPA: hypothetical protein VI462_07400 [Acidimicrobiia bacterium]|jgi:hypothetical protein